ncbi:ESX secretion-associated protein EspG [Amycolatopsis suaedae]|uniref:ESX secretion-associated protein EspG n=1 Tax=Amycolatopsis suaedae TaxID=2510978 RepID=A0A4Q7J5M1_9PSEU|nr:ESX secretion-associated protein EspG [Amycolatopsis suaedae]RZQ61992.1 ESX secretion-associated protein EspG [Amycolatopsis suaedae]
MRDPDSGWIQLHPAEFFLLWSTMGLGELPTVLGIPHIGRTASARAALSDAASQALAERDLGTVNRPARDLGLLLRTLAEAELRLDMTADGDDYSFRSASSVDRGGAAVSVGVAGETVRLGPVREPMLVATMLEALTPLKAAPGVPANIRVSDYTDACAEGERLGAEGFVAVLRDAGVRPPEVNTMVRAVTGRRGGGQFGASVRGRGSSWIRTPSTVNWVDTDEGRYALRSRDGWLTATPVDDYRLRIMAQEMVGEITRH